MSTPSAAGSKPSILVIDDEDAVLRYVKMYLETRGFDVLVADSGAGGLEIARSCPLTAVICDITLPEMDGFAVARALRQIPHLAHTRLFAMSGYDIPGDTLTQAGFENWLHKPFNADELQKLLRELTASGGQS
jgi:two-component system, chemotaxis family, CheB/CheR fusion protein